ncbi:bifunctional DNA-formamidopyrimidine glycosylase/DNA-(apurinic or apyrimidinic site) lyase [Patescibacteria group bacterium]
MPELPEVETQVRHLRKLVVGHKIKDVWSDTKKIVHGTSYVAFKKDIVGRKIIAFRRRGKNILMDLSGGKTAIVHFRMTGHFLYSQNTKDKWWLWETEPYVRFAMKLDNNAALLFSDIRKFGTIHYTDTANLAENHILAKLGPEPLADSFSFEKFREIMSSRKGIIKPILLNQTVLVGIGNIYADESLYDAGIHPRQRVDRLTDADLKKLYKAIRKNLSDGIKHKGTTVGEYVDARGKSGKHQNYLRVYKKKGEKCAKRGCSGKVKRIVVAQRGTHYCPRCQKLK